MQGTEHQVSGFRRRQRQANGFKVAQMYSAIQTGQNVGMQTLDQNLKELLGQGVVSKEEAQRKAAHPDSL